MKKPTAITILFLFLSGGFPFSGFCQFNPEGTWTGYITQEPEGLASRYFFQTEFHLNGNNLLGTTTIRMENEPGVFGKMTVLGTWDGQKISFWETEITGQKIWNFAYWCLKSCELVPQQEGNKWILTGHWLSENCAGTGEIRLEKPDVM